MAVHRTNETYEAFQIIQERQLLSQIEDDTDELVIVLKKVVILQMLF